MGYLLISWSISLRATRRVISEPTAAHPPNYLPFAMDLSVAREYKDGPFHIALATGQVSIRIERKVFQASVLTGFSF